MGRETMNDVEKAILPGYLYNFKGFIDRLPRDPEHGDIYMVKDKMFLWADKWYILNPEPCTLRQKIQVLLDNISLTEEQLKESIKDLIEND